MAVNRCEDCGGELTSCGKMSYDGPLPDCLLCKQRETINSLKSENASLRKRVEGLVDLAKDAVSALRYIEQTFGRVPGIGWDRVYKKTTDASEWLKGNMNG